MTEQKRFNYRSLEDLKADIATLGLGEKILLEDDFSVLGQPLKIEGVPTIANRFAVHPMEGFDSAPDGTPGELAFRRYLRYAHGQYGLIWFEACAVLHEARSNPSQMWINDGNWQVFADLVEKTRKASVEQNGFAPVCILQLTHSGRYSRPEGVPAPIIAHHSKFLDPIHKLPADYPLVTDDYLDRLQDTYVHAAELAEKAGFDGVDIKGCHRYLMAELQASHLREGRYGGSLENRTHLMRETMAKVRQKCPNLLVTTRLNACDMMPYPYGFAMAKDGSLTPDLEETRQYITWLREIGIKFINLSIANPYYEPHYGRPYDKPIINGAPSPEHPLVGVARILDIVAQVQAMFPGFPIIGTGYSWLRQFIPYAAVGTVKAGRAAMVGLGRSAFAYPDLPYDLFHNGAADPRKCCITCSCCTQIMRDGSHTGCVIRDAEVYRPWYNACTAKYHNN